MPKTTNNQTIEAFEAWGELSVVGLNIYSPSGHLETSFDLPVEEARKLAISLLQAAAKHEAMESLAATHDSYDDDEIPF